MRSFNGNNKPLSSLKSFCGITIGDILFMLKSHVYLHGKKVNFQTKWSIILSAMILSVLCKKNGS